MNSSNTKNKLKIAVSMSAMALLAAGCHTEHHYTAYTHTPLAMTADQTSQEASMGGTGSSYQTESGSGGQSTNDVVIPLEKENVHIATQPVNGGAVRIRKIVKTENISQPVQVRTESVTVDRVPANAQSAQASGQNSSLSTPFKEGEMTINLQSEQPIVQTQIVPAGSVVIHKQVNTQPLNVQAQVRSEDVEAVKVGNPQNVTISKNVSGEGLASTGSANDASGAAPSATGQSGGGGGSEITQPSQLMATGTDPSSMAGQRVNFSNCKVQRVIGSHLIVVGSEGSAPVYVRIMEPASGITAGQTVSVKGVVERVPSSPSSLGLGQESSSALQGQQIFINATSVTPGNQ
jgi:stress response protein YsnF